MFAIGHGPAISHTHTHTRTCRKEASIVRTHASIVCVCLVAQISLDSAAAGLEESEPLKEPPPRPPPPLRPDLFTF